MLRSVARRVALSFHKLFLAAPSKAPGRRLICEPLEARRLLTVFDFGMISSPVGLGDVGVAATVYNSTLGYGWRPGDVIWGADRAVGNAEERDLNFTADGTFFVDVIPGMYKLDLVLGDLGAFPHDQVQIYLDNKNIADTSQAVNPIDMVSTAPGTIVTKTYFLPVTPGGHIALRLQSVAGNNGVELDPNAAIESLTVTAVPADLAPPTVEVKPAAGLDMTAVSPINFTVTFSEPVTGLVPLQAADFALTPLGAAVVGVTGQGTTYNVAVTGPAGPVTLQVNAGAANDLSGFPNIVSNVANVTLVGPAGPQSLFDFGLDATVPATGWTRVGPTHAGWTAGTRVGWERRTGNALSTETVPPQYLDFNLTNTGTFDVPGLAVGTVYFVEMVLGDVGDYFHDHTQVTLSDGAGVPIGVLDLVSTAPGELTSLTSYVILPGLNTTLRIAIANTVPAGDVTVDTNAVIESLAVTQVAAAPAPTVTIRPAASEANPRFDRPLVGDQVNFTVVFDQPVTGFAAPADVSTAGSTAVVGAPTITGQGTTYNVAVPITAFGVGDVIAAVNVGAATNFAAVANALASANMDNKVLWAAAAAADAYLFSFDFGTGVAGTQEPGTTAAIAGTATAYAAVPGYGWLPGPPIAVADRGGVAASPLFSLLDRDLNSTPRGQFRVDAVQAGPRAVDLVLGDLGPYAHDGMQIFLNGVLVDTVSTKPREVKRVSYTYNNSAAGPLIVELVDGGGIDPNVAIEALEIR